MEIPQQLQDKLAQFQNLQNQLQMVSVQRQQLQMQSADVSNAKKELEKAAADGKVYRLVGPMFIETNKAEGLEYLIDEDESAQTKIKVLEKQEKKLTEKLNDMRTELTSMMKPPVGGSP